MRLIRLYALLCAGIYLVLTYLYPKQHWFLAWYDAWIGLYIKDAHTVYFCPLPAIAIKFEDNNNDS